MLPTVRMRTAPAAYPALLAGALVACGAGEMDGQGDHLRVACRAARNVRCAVRRRAGRSSTARSWSRSTRSASRAGSCSPASWPRPTTASGACSSVAVAGLFWFKQVGIADKYVQQDEADQELAFQKAFTLEAAMTGDLHGDRRAGGAADRAGLRAVEDRRAGAGRCCSRCPAVVLQTPVWVHYRSMDFARQRTLQAVDPVVGFVVMVALAVAGLGYWALVIGDGRGRVGGGDRVRGELARTRCACATTAARCASYASFSWPLFLRPGRALAQRRRSTCSPARACSAWPASAAMTLASQISQLHQQVDQILASTLYPAICAVRDRRDLLFESFVKSNRLALHVGHAVRRRRGAVRRRPRAVRDRRALGAGGADHQRVRAHRRDQPPRLQLGRLLPRAGRHEADRGLGLGEPRDDAARSTLPLLLVVRARRLRGRDGGQHARLARRARALPDAPVPRLRDAAPCGAGDRPDRSPPPTPC